MTHTARLKKELEGAGFSFAKEGTLWRCRDGTTCVAEATALSDCVERAARLLGVGHEDCKAR